MTFMEMHGKWSVTLADRLAPEILIVLEINALGLTSSDDEILSGD